MDDITPNATNNQNAVNQPVGCSTICVNQPDCVRLKFYSWVLAVIFLTQNASFRRKFWHTLKMHLKKFWITFTLFLLTLLNRRHKGNIMCVAYQFVVIFEWLILIFFRFETKRWPKNDLRHSAMQVIYPGIQWVTIIMVSFFRSIRLAQTPCTAEKHVII